MINRSTAALVTGAPFTLCLVLAAPPTAHSEPPAVHREGLAAAKHAFATQLNATNIAQLQPRGPDALAGIDDWVLGNGHLCAAISDIGHTAGFNPWGGGLIDVYHCTQGRDRWPYSQLLPNLNKDTPFKPEAIRAATTADNASITVTATGEGLSVETRYLVSERNPWELRIEHTVTRFGQGDALHQLGSMVLHPNLSLQPFALSTQNAEHNVGFDQVSWDRNSLFDIAKATMPVDTQVLVGDQHLANVSYGVHLRAATLTDREGTVHQLPRFALNDPSYTVQGVFTRPLWLGSKNRLGLLELAQSLFMDVKKGETLRLAQSIVFGSRADVASVTDQLYTGRWVTGSVPSHPAVIHVATADGKPLTAVTVDEQGQYQARLPEWADDITLSLRSPWEPTQRVIEATQRTHSSNHVNADPIPQSWLSLPQAGPMRLIFVGVDGTPDPNLNDNLMGGHFIGGKTQTDLRDSQDANYVSLAGIPSDPQRIALPPGSYRVLATRGPLYSVTETRLTITADSNVSLNIEPPMREVRAEHWLSADLHVHAAHSFDSHIPIAARLRSFAAQGADVLVATEHNNLVDYRDQVDTLGLTGTVAVINGAELTGLNRSPEVPFTNGHVNVFPLQEKPWAYAGGLPEHDGIRLRRLYHHVAQAFDAPLVQLNHPLSGEKNQEASDGDYLSHLIDGIAYDPQQPLDSPTNRSLIEPDPTTGLRDVDFDILEVANGHSFERYERTRDAWFALLRDGERIVGSANSDSHGAHELVATPVNFLRIPEDYSEQAFIAALRAGRVVGSTGPLINAWASHPGQSRVELGESLNHREFTLHIEVDAASWVPLNTLTVFINGEVYHQQPIRKGERIALPVTAQVDGFVVVQVTGEADARYQLIAPTFTPFAFTNPIYIDSLEASPAPAASPP